MATVAADLAASRAAHRAGRTFSEKKDFVKAREQFTVALDYRLKAREADPGHTDPAWGEDFKSLHSRRQFDQAIGRELRKAKDEPDPAGYDAPSTRIKTSAAVLDRELEAYFRQQLGDSPNTSQALASVAIPPDQWQTFQAGVTVCASCTHHEDSHDEDGCGVSQFKDGVLVDCDCAGYTASICRHVWEKDSTSQRTCAACSEIQRLQPSIALEDTLAFKQLQKEQQGRA